MQEMRIIEHSILGDLKLRKKVQIIVDGKKMDAFEGEPVAAALIAAGKKVFHRTVKRNEPRGYYCAIGVCSDCFMVVNGQPNIRTCVTPVEEGMRVETQIGKGEWKGIE